MENNAFQAGTKRDKVNLLKPIKLEMMNQAAAIFLINQQILDNNVEVTQP